MRTVSNYSRYQKVWSCNLDRKAEFGLAINFSDLSLIPNLCVTTLLIFLNREL
jgi:hypothetical protein